MNESLTNLGDNQMIPFPDVRTDTHSAFHGPTGLFTCPESGYYYFVVSLLAFRDADVSAAIVVNNYWVVALYAKGSPTNEAADHGTSGGVVYLHANDRVWVRINQIFHHGTGKMLAKDYSTFSGFKI